MRRNDARAMLRSTVGLTAIPDLVAKLGGDADSLLSEVGLSPGDLLDPVVQVPATALALLLPEAAKVTGCSHFGALLAARRDLRTLWVLNSRPPRKHWASSLFSLAVQPAAFFRRPAVLA